MQFFATTRVSNCNCLIQSLSWASIHNSRNLALWSATVCLSDTHTATRVHLLLPNTTHMHVCTVTRLPTQLAPVHFNTCPDWGQSVPRTNRTNVSKSCFRQTLTSHWTLDTWATKRIMQLNGHKFNFITGDLFLLFSKFYVKVKNATVCFWLSLGP